MGWSCRVDAGETLDKITAACVEQGGSSNVYEDGGAKFFFEVSRKEHADGAITGTIFKFLDGEKCIKAGAFRINGDGSIARAPGFFKEAAKRPEPTRFRGTAIGSGGCL